MGLRPVVNGDAFGLHPCVPPMPIGLALYPVRGIVAATACITTAWLLRIAAVVHGLGLCFGLAVRSQTLRVFKTDRLRTPVRHMSKT